MPLAVAAVTTPTPTPTDPTPTPTTPIPQEQVGSIHAVWIAPDGTEVELSSPDPGTGHFTTRGIGGWGATPVSRVDDPASRGGVLTRHVRDEPRSLTWPLHIWGATHVEFTTRMRAIVRAFTQTRYLGPGTLRITHPDGSAREILAYYEDGLGGDVGQGWVSASPVLTLFCPNGFWRDVESLTDTRSYSVGTPYLAPYPTVSSGRVLGDTQLTNPGEADAWPSWVITGPATQVTATNHTTGEAFTLTYTLASAETITVTTDPPTVRGPAGQVLTSALNWPGAELWPLQPGVNDVEFAVSGSGAGTAIELSYVPRYEMW